MSTDTDKRLDTYDEMLVMTTRVLDAHDKKIDALAASLLALAEAAGRLAGIVERFGATLDEMAGEGVVDERLN